MLAAGAAQTVTDAATLLGDTEDNQYPIYRASTLFTLVLHKYKLLVWVNTNPKNTEPVYVWDLKTFFNEDDGNEKALVLQ